MSLSEQEKDIVVQALQFYLQQASGQVPPSSMQQLVVMVQNIVAKLDNLEASSSRKAHEPPPGIKEDWYENVCLHCQNLTQTGCSDKITVKFPGKCDPILKYERNKASLDR